MDSELVIATSRGWSCSNTSGLDLEHEIERDLDGNPTLVRETQVLVSENTYNVKDQLQEGDDVECLFCVDGEKNVTFVGRIKSVVGSKVSIEILNEFEDGKKVKELAIKIDKLFN